MEGLAEALNQILREITSDDSETRREYLAKFKGEAESFSRFIAEAFTRWRSIDDKIGENQDLALVSGLVYTGITLQIQSMKLFLSGHTVAAGNLFRQVLETIALGLLCSAKRLKFRKLFMNDQYSSNLAVRDVIRHAQELGVQKDALKVLRDAQAFYSKYSHPTMLTIASTMAMSGKGLYVGASFDADKVFAYEKEIKGRLGLARMYPSFTEAVKLNLAKW